MNPSDLYDIWAPPDGVWSPWAKPVLFAEGKSEHGEGRSAWDEAREGVERRYELPQATAAALVLDLPGPEALALALEGARHGWRPVPLFNSCDGIGALVDNKPLILGLAQGAAVLREAGLHPESPPAFVLDSRRLRGDPRPSCFDNRWMVFPQDFPSAAMLASRGIMRVYLIQDGRSKPRSDLAQVLLRWQRAGIEILAIDRSGDGTPAPITVEKPSRFYALGQRVFALVGLRRSSAGGFGAVVPLVQRRGGGWA
jgi:hypothetical protein